MSTPTVTPYKQLRRPLDDRIVAGVCSGIGRYFAVDPVLIRVAFAIAVVGSWGIAALAYPVVWFLMPEEVAPAPLRSDHSSWGAPSEPL
ncbi:PspC domain-containing protein [Actinoplanes sp. N902-109]|uniref:PspC domain-containing protein n=1 Tax=Actinoplanes sp. (strain N902-109) TaxID=649831 RepID=UPI000329596A|nr:PspC domain-containing protein [Actinoplanes sp. N902-109]AGL14536.1 phage shock protein pspC [Actinoplanes sp. N902-109]